MSDTLSRRDALLGTAAAAAALAVVPGTAEARQQPNMHAAIDSLRAARASLQKANDNKGGHRLRAISLIDQAIDEVQKGIRFAERNS